LGAKPPPKGRGALGNPGSRYLSHTTETVDDGWHSNAPPPLRTTLSVDHVRSALSWNDAPDIPFDRSLNPYRGCEHGCIYCYARPYHAWIDLSPGLDFESRLFHKPDLPERLRDELGNRSYRPAPIVIGTATDAYQPIEHTLELTRRTIEVLLDCRHPFTIITKSALIERDTDLLGATADLGLARVILSITTLQPGLARTMEPRAASPTRRLQTIATLAKQGIPVGIMIAPIVPVLTDHELERLMAAGREAGACAACYSLLRLPGEVSGLFREWLDETAPDASKHVMNRLRETHGGLEQERRFGARMTGSGVYADLMLQRFRLAERRLGFGPPPPLRCDLFRPPDRHGQLSLF